MSRIMQADVINFQDHSEHIKVSYTTDNLCHRCGCALPNYSPKAFYTLDENQAWVYLIFECFHCHQAFMLEYNKMGIASLSSKFLDLSRSTPSIHPNQKTNTKFSIDIQTLSKKFVEIYHQAENAEDCGFDEICGIGYRKALEFLVKDYLCLSNPDDKEKIAGENLRVAIKRFSDKRIQTLADRAAWIGNDETHYVRKHEDYDVSDIKKFIHAIVYYLQSELAFADADSIDTTR